MMEEDPSDNEEILDDDISDEDEKGPWFNVEMSKEEKIEARRPWHNSIIIWLIGRNIEYHYLCASKLCGKLNLRLR